MISAGYDEPVVIVGAGPAGLSAAYELTRHGRSCTVLEASGVAGGLSRTVEYKGCRFDIGGHRFFTKVAVVDRMWHEILGADFLQRPRLSRIYYRSRLFQYPLNPFNALSQLGPVEAARCVASYLAARIRPRNPEPDLETWLINRFGRRLYEIFFRSYTEKVWGMPCGEIRAEWASQRIRGLSLFAVIANALKPAGRGTSAKTLIEQFHYPRFGPGQMWTRTAEHVERSGGRILYNHPVERICWSPGGISGIHAGGRRFAARHFLSSMPIRDLVRLLDPAPPPDAAFAGAGLKYRDFLTVALIVRATDLFPDNWIYIHDPKIQAGRVQNYNNWSPGLVPDPTLTCLGFEYFCSDAGQLWSMSDGELIALASAELGKLGLGDPAAIVDGCVIRAPKAYPVYDDEYQGHLAAVRGFLESVPNLQLIGRNGMHRYNNQDHSMLTGMLAARNIMGHGPHDLWQVNADTDYHEEGFSMTRHETAALECSQPLVPASLRRSEP